MKNIKYLLLIILVFINLPTFGQIVLTEQERQEALELIANDHDHTCVSNIPHDMDAVRAARAKLKKVRSNTNSSSRSSVHVFDRSLMKHFILYVYDDVLLDQYTSAEVEGTIIEQSLNRIAAAHECAGIEYAGFEYIFLPVDLDGVAYDAIHDIFNMIFLPNGQLHWVMEKKINHGYHFIQAFSRKDVIGHGTATMLTPQFPDPNNATSVVDFLNPTVGTNTCVHEMGGHNCGGDHKEGESVSSISAPTARAYAMADAWTPVTATTINSIAVDCWSGMNSKIVIDQDTVTLSDGNANNAAAIQDGLDILIDVVDRTMVQLFDHEGDCGMATITALSNNADTWTWSAMDGADVEFLSDEGTNIMGIIAHEAATIRVIGQLSTEIYGDTVYFDMPAMTTINDDPMQVCEGDPLPLLGDGSLSVVGENTYMMPAGSCFEQHKVFVQINEHTSSTVDTTMISGQLLFGETVEDQDTVIHIYEGVLPTGCDSIVTYVVHITTATINIKQERLVLYPNPTTGHITIKGDKVYDEIQVYSEQLQLLKTSSNSKTTNIGNLVSGLYIIRAIDGKNVITGKVIKY